MTKKAILIGNGESRLGIDFKSIAGFKIGCNAAYRDFDLDCLVAVDRRMVIEATRNSFHKTIYTRQDWINDFRYCENIEVLPDLPYKGDKKVDNPFDWGSGPYACLLAAVMGFGEIHMYGFDLWGKDEKVNNVYKDTINYNSSSYHAVDPRFWIYQMAKCFEYYPNRTWVQYQPDGWKKPNEWNFDNLVIKNAA